MAGDWIKMRSNLWDDPRVARIVDLTDSTEAAVVGALYWLWATADQHSSDGIMPGLTLRAIDRKTGVQGFGDALVAIGWLADHPEGVRIVRFDEHNGSSAKRRSTDAQRKATVRRLSASDADIEQTDCGCSVELEKEKEKEREKNPPNPPNPPAGGDGPASKTPKRERADRISLKTFIARCEANGQKPISDYRPVLEYVEATGIPLEFVGLAWDVFKAEHLPPGINAARLQADWRRHFLNYVSKGYYRLWIGRPDGTFELTTAGLQAKAVQRARRRTEAETA
jgi:hypothetical protein